MTYLLNRTQCWLRVHRIVIGCFMSDLTKEEIIEATIAGVAKGVERHLSGLHLSIVSEAIKEGVEGAFSCDVAEVIRKAIIDAMPYESKIINAIGSGCERTKGRHDRKNKRQ